MAGSLTTWRWHLWRAAERAGLPGWAAALLALTAAVAWLAVGQPLRDRTAELSVDNDLLAHRVAAQHRAPASRPALSPERQVALFEQSMVTERKVSPAYGELWKLAQKNGLSLRQAEFKYTPPALSDGLGRYSMVLPIEAEYPALRAFIAQSLQAFPALALESVELRRDDARATRLHATLHFVMFVARGA